MAYMECLGFLLGINVMTPNPSTGERTAGTPRLEQGPEFRPGGPVVRRESCAWPSHPSNHRGTLISS